jgi:hypothetical protein
MAARHRKRRATASWRNVALPRRLIGAMRAD